MASGSVHAPLPSLDCAPKKCYNSDCSEFTSRKGWRLSSGELADLCDRCASAYEEGRFCETFHPNAPGWRCCLTCGRRFHCGCMASCNAFQLLDFGGIMCSECARHRFRGAPATTCFPLFVYDEIFKDHPVQKWIHIFGPGPEPLQQAPFFSSSIPHSYMQPTTPHESGRLIAGGNSSGASEGLQTGNRKSAALVVRENENAGASKKGKPGSSRDIMLLPSSGEQSFAVQHERQMPIVSLTEANGRIVASETPLQQSSSALVLKEVQGTLRHGVDSTVGTRKCNKRPRPEAHGKGKLHPRDIMQLPSSGEESFAVQHEREMPIVTLNEANGQIVASETPPQQSSSALILEEVQGNLQNGVESTVGTRKHNYRPRADARGKGKLHPRYWPRFTAEELRQIAGNSNALVTPLFEKMLSATDAGKTGRLVLPKNYAEAYFPPLENQGGLSLRIQDTEGKDWIFRYRFWPNNKSRMYVLEGVAHYMKHMQLQARDTVTFSRLEPEGKLVMGFRKAHVLRDRQDNDTRQAGNGVLLIRDASTQDNDTRQAGNGVLLIQDASTQDNDTRQAGNGVLLIRDASTQDNDTRQAGNGVLLIQDASTDNDTRQAGNGVLVIRDASMQENDTRQAGNGVLLIRDASMENDTRQAGNGVLLIGDGSMAEMADPSLQSKVEGKSSIRKRKSSTLGNEEKIELMWTWEGARDSLCPLPNQTPNVVVIEEVEFEEYRDAPVLGKPTVFAVDQSGFEVQWVQCDDCSKWRKVPADAHLSIKWTCSNNTWDLERSLCSARQELTAKQLKDLIPSHLRVASKKSKAPKKKVDSAKATEGLDTLSRAADLVVITGEKGEPSNLTTKHPRHGPSCSCIVCTQPPNDKSPTAKRPFKKRASKREAEPSKRNVQQDKTPDAGSLPSNNAGAGNPSNQPRRDGEKILAITGGAEITNSSSHQEQEKDNAATSAVKVSAAAA